MKDAPDRDRPMHTIAAGHAAVRDADEDGVVGQEQRPTAMRATPSQVHKVEEGQGLALRPLHVSCAYV